MTSERIWRVSFVASVIGVAFASIQFAVRFRRDERRKARKQLVKLDMDKLTSIRRRIDAGTNAVEGR